MQKEILTMALENEKIEYIYDVDDPVIGFVSCSSLEEAREYAAKVGGDVYKAGWLNGEEISLERIP
jgi:ABC-type sugar transport system substrate-binding protein